MRNKVYNLRNYAFTCKEKILVDTNVWIYLFPPPGNPRNDLATTYSRAFLSMIQAGAIPVVDPLIASEYLNRYCRIEWEVRFRNLYPTFKTFRKSPDFLSVAHSASTFASNILAKSAMHNVHTGKPQLSQAIQDFQSGQLDFNDTLLVDLCKQLDMKLLTNDSDFQTGGIDILTANPKLLKLSAEQ
ncbi:MAG: type II toxin-antitoxin system VapC family toxin [Chlorobi bacterium]|nr:type II toxin-antitoxin system VapC family toxin [Chlorobiota bacterium]